MRSSQTIEKGASGALAKEPGSDSLSADAPEHTEVSFDRLRMSGGFAIGDPGPPTAAIHTHGCKLNQADSEALSRSFAEAGYRIVEWTDGADVMVLNTCTITATADAKARQALRGARRRVDRKALVVATGCYAQRAADQLAEVEGVTLVVGNTGKDRLVATATAALDQALRSRLSPIFVPSVKGSYQSVSSEDRSPLPVEMVTGGIISGVNGTVPSGVNGTVPAEDWPPLKLSSRTEPAQQRTRAMIKIQEGCDQVCAYCIVPKVRGRERSVHPDVLLEQIQQRIDQGCQEVVLTGTQLGTYGFDLAPGVLVNESSANDSRVNSSLAALLQRILRETGITRLRVSSLQPQEITEALLELWSDPRLCPHFHVPLQSGCDQILKAMRRRYDTSQFAAKVDLIRKTLPSVGITTDIIVGFPGEGEKEYQASKDFARSMQFSDIHIFPYSPRPGTSAAYLKDRAIHQVRKERVAEMGEVASEGFRRFRLGQLGGHRPVLWESSQPKGAATMWSGLTDNYIRVRTQSEADLRNVVTQVELLQLAEESVLVSIR